MSDYFTTMPLVAGIITVAVLMVVFFLIIPLRISLSFHFRGREIQGILNGSWFIFGIELLVSGNDPRLSFTIGDVRLVTRPVSTLKDPRKKSSGDIDASRVIGIVLLLPTLQGLVLNAILDLIRHTRLDYVHGNARIGLGDPAATGMLYGMYRAIGPLFPSGRINFNLIPEFDGDVCEIDLKTRFHISLPVRMIINAVRIVKHPVLRKMMKKTFRGTPAEAAG